MKITFDPRRLLFCYAFIALTLSILNAGCKSRYYTSDIYRMPKPENVFDEHYPPAPLGMVYIPPGRIDYYVYREKPLIVDSTDLYDTVHGAYQLSGFFMDVTETTNRQYRTFVDWVADSIAVVKFLKDDKYFIVTKRYGQSKKTKKVLAINDEKDKSSVEVQRPINWSLISGSKPLWQSENAEIMDKLKDKLVSYRNGRPELVDSLLWFKYKHWTQDKMGRLSKTNDSILVYPDVHAWGRDLPYSESEIIHQHYFTINLCDNYPVVGVNWNQANAYAYWRGLFIQTQISSRLGYEYLLPTEMQYHYVTSTGLDTVNLRKKIVSKNRKAKKDTIFYVNFKQGPGDFKKDGTIYTAPVKAYYTNKYGIYNLFGNVAEWTMDSFTGSPMSFADDLDPALLYLNKPDSSINKRKVIVGGSWGSGAKELHPYARDHFVSDSTSSKIGFRCILPAR